MTNKAVNGYLINVFTSKENFLESIKDETKILVAMNAEKLLKEDQKLRDIINNNIGYCDGIGAVMALKEKGLNDAIKIPGSEFWLDIINKYKNEKTFYLVGSTQEVIESTVGKLKKEFPNINIVGYRNGFLDEKDKEKLKNSLLKLQPNIVFIAQGSPKQEFLMDELIQVHPALYMGLGGSFDIYGGVKKRAPAFFLKWHLEWFYRLIKEPMRIGRQLNLIKFLFLLKTGRL